jgi:hypothetical protein
MINNRYRVADTQLHDAPIEIAILRRSLSQAILPACSVRRLTPAVLDEAGVMVDDASDHCVFAAGSWSLLDSCPSSQACPA